MTPIWIAPGADFGVFARSVEFLRSCGFLFAPLHAQKTLHCNLVIAGSRLVRPEAAGPMTGSATTQSTSSPYGLLRSARNDAGEHVLL
jgi:hypothetical protein